MLMEPNGALERMAPEALGVAPQGILDFLEEAEDRAIPLHGFMLLRHGKVAAEGCFRPFGMEDLHPVFSVSKSITSAAVGIAAGEGLLRLEDRIADYFPEKLEGELHPYTAMMTVEDLLKMATVHLKSTDTQTDDWVKGFLNTPPSRLPGTAFAYDTTGTHTLCAILQKVTGQTVHEYLKPRLFEPIGMGRIEWESCPMGINKGGSGIRCTVEALARFGQLYLQDGVWNGVRLLPEGWVEASTGKRIDTSVTRVMMDGRKGYGYQFWRVRHNAYCAFGMGGQLVVVMPERDAVFVTTANTLQFKDGQQQLLDCLWSTLYPAMAEEGAPVAKDPAAAARLAERLGRLTLHMPEGSGQRTPPAGLQALSGQRWRLDPNRYGFEACEFHWDGTPPALRFIQGAEEKELRFGWKEWAPGTDPFLGQDCIGAAVWTDERTLVITAHLLYPLQMFVLHCRFLDGRISIHTVPAGAAMNDHEGGLNGRPAD